MIEKIFGVSAINKSTELEEHCCCGCVQDCSKPTSYFEGTLWEHIYLNAHEYPVK